ncbi:MAG TPA: energy transducer TonB [Steroidobacteraceae bacterium]|jgi:protein TonB
MFEDSLVESAALLRTHNRWPAVISITAQLCAAALILTIPLLHPELLPMPHILPATLAPPRAPAPPPPPIHLEPRAAASMASAPAAPTAAQTTSLFRDLIHPTGPAVDAPPITIFNLGNTDASLPPGINSAAPAGPHVTVGLATRSSTPPRISSGVSAGNLISPLRPEYPSIAKAAHVEGTVVVDAIISRSGSIESAHAVSGPPMLQAAALAAVRQARYRPFLLNGQPTEVHTTITINFRMGS